MATDTNDEDRPLDWNGIDARTGQYLFEPLSSAQLAQLARGKAVESQKADRDGLAELKFRAARGQEAHFGVKEGIDPSRLEQAGSHGVPGQRDFCAGRDLWDNRGKRDSDHESHPAGSRSFRPGQGPG